MSQHTLVFWWWVATTWMVTMWQRLRQLRSFPMINVTRDQTFRTQSGLPQVGWLQHWQALIYLLCAEAQWGWQMKWYYLLKHVRIFDTNVSHVFLLCRVSLISAMLLTAPPGRPSPPCPLLGRNTPPPHSRMGLFLLRGAMMTQERCNKPFHFFLFHMSLCFKCLSGTENHRAVAEWCLPPRPCPSCHTDRTLCRGCGWGLGQEHKSCIH